MPSSSSSIPPQRLPAPSLFVAPPSQNASNVELSKQITSSSHPSAKSRSDTATIRITPSAAIPAPTSPFSPSDVHKQPGGGLQPPSPNKSRRSANQRESEASEKDKERDYNSRLNNDYHFPPPPPIPTTNKSRSDSNSSSVGLSASQQGQNRPRRSTAILDAHWAALQSTLSDIELSASGTTHVFGQNHAVALEDLRKAQVELARAWGPRAGPDEQAGESVPGVDRMRNDTKRATADGNKTATNSVNGAPGVNNKSGDNDTLTSRTSTTTATSNRPATKQDSPEKNKQPTTASANMSVVDGVSTREADADLDAAEQRRKESDAYFKRVKGGVEEVVRKLESVSRAMRDVEMESREIWGDGGSEGSTELDSIMT